MLCRKYAHRIYLNRVRNELPIYKQGHVYLIKMKPTQQVQRRCFIWRQRIKIRS